MRMMPNRGQFAVLLGVLALTACAPLARAPVADGLTGSDKVLVSRLSQADILLLGEVHDNVAQHGRRLNWLIELARTRSIVLVMEQLDADAQAALETARAALPALPLANDELDRAARTLAQAGGFNFDGWDWALYGPVIRWAIVEGIELRGANLSATQTMAIARGQAHRLADARPAQWGEAQDAAMARLIREGHCDLLPERMIAPMARAQRARDARMAEALADAVRASSRPDRLVVLMAGNGHVRRDLGVAAHLAERLPAARMVTVGLLETGDGGADVFDEAVMTPRQSREDPCESLRRRFGSPTRSG